MRYVLNDLNRYFISEYAAAQYAIENDISVDSIVRKFSEQELEDIVNQVRHNLFKEKMDSYYKKWEKEDKIQELKNKILEIENS